MSTLTRTQALEELRLFSIGAAAGTAFVISLLFVFRGSVAGIMMFVWVATRTEYGVLFSYVFDIVMRPRVDGEPRFLPATALMLGGALPVTLVSLRYLL